LIVISGALAVVAFVLLIAGLVQSGLGLVYASIAVSVVSAVFLGVGAYQRRGEEVALAGGAPAPTEEPADEVTRVVPVAPVAPIASVTEGDTDTDDEPARQLSSVGTTTAIVSDDGGSSVLVVPGRPRYHVEGCRYLAGKSGEERSLAEARNEGYTACGICRPDENLGRSVPQPAFSDADDDIDEDEEPLAAITSRSSRAPSRTTRKTTSKKTAASSRSTTAKKAPASRSTAKKATKSSTAKKASSSSRSSSTAKKATKSTASKSTAKSSPSRSTSTAKRSTSTSSAKKTASKTAAKRTTKASASKTAKKTTAKKTARKR